MLAPGLACELVPSNCTVWPQAAGFGFADIAAVGGGARFTVCKITGDVLLLKPVAPEYEAVITCNPAARVEVLNVAMPPSSVPVPSVVPRSLNVTTPVGVPPVALTVAVNVTG